MRVNLKLVSKKQPTQEQKADYVERHISRKYEKEDRESGAVNIPHFMRAKTAVKEIKCAGALDSEYKKLQRKGF